MRSRCRPQWRWMDDIREIANEIWISHARGRLWTNVTFPRKAFIQDWWMNSWKRARWLLIFLAQEKAITSRAIIKIWRDQTLTQNALCCNRQIKPMHTQGTMSSPDQTDNMLNEPSTIRPKSLLFSWKLIISPRITGLKLFSTKFLLCLHPKIIANDFFI